MESDPTTQIFNERLALWVARQGFWFQMRYAMAGGGTSILMFHLLRILLRLVILLAIISLVGLAYLVKLPEQTRFKNELRNKIVSGLHCDTGIMRSFVRQQNKASIRHLALTGGPDCFFHSCEAGGITFRMGLLDSISKTWNANQIVVDRLSLNVKAGAETAEEAATLGKSLFQTSPNLTFQTFESKNTRISWGYSERTMGSISQSNMLVIRENNNWRIKFTKGVFQQNWLRNLQIDELVLLCTDKGITVEKGEFHIGSSKGTIGAKNPLLGKVVFNGLKIEGGQRPQFSGNIQLENVPVEELLQETYTPYIEGSISGELKIQGSTNSPDGISFSGRMALRESDHLTTRGRLHILNTLSILCPSGTYRKTTFTEGFFTVKTSAGSLVVSDINLSAPDQMELKGSFNVRPPKQQEIDEMLRKGTVSNELLEGTTAVPASSSTINTPKSDELTLAQAVKMSKKQAENKGATGFIDDDIDLGTPFHTETLEAELQLKSAEKAALTSIYEGKLQLILPVKNFPADTSLLDVLPLTPNNQFFVLDCPLTGNVFEVTLNQAEELLLMKKNAQNPVKDKATVPIEENKAPN
jgi:hypothetical protein